MNTYEYWIGKDIDYMSVWQAYEEGFDDYVNKFYSMRVHLLRIELKQFPLELPLFNHEVVYKTIKGYFHDFKLYSLSDVEYGDAGPLFLYSVDRGTGIWNLLGEQRTVVASAATLAILGQELDIYEKKLQIIQKYFPEANPNDINRFIKARKPRGLLVALSKLIAQGIERLEVSQNPFDGNLKETEKSLIDIQQLIIMGDQIVGDKIGRNKAQAGQNGIAVVGKITSSHITKHVIASPGRNDLETLAHELSQLRQRLHGQSTKPEQDVDVGQIAAAEIAARNGDRRSALLHLKNVGAWALDFATQAGASLTAELMKKAMGF